jgi:hypothetical protein
VIEVVVDPNEPPLPERVVKFTGALARGEKDRFAIIKDVLLDKVREVI